MDESHVRLPESSRIGDKVMEYYLKYGKDRKLEKFMRFHSPSGSTRSSTITTTTTSSSSNDDWMGDLKCLFQEEECSKVSNKSPTKKEHIVPIEIEIDSENQPINQPSESPKTPVRSKETFQNVVESKTPESIAKSHKRLEWDSLADIGYKKSKSTSNISIVERMLLREFFEVTSNSPKNTNSSESDIRLLEQEIAELGTLRKHFVRSTYAIEETNYGTPPLASSTQLEEKKQKSRKEPKTQAVGTSISTLHQKLEKSAQISAKKEPKAYTVGTSTSKLQQKFEKSAQTSSRKEAKINEVGTSTSTLQQKLEKAAQTSSRKEAKINEVGTSTSTLQQKLEKAAQTSLRKAETASQGVQVTLKQSTFSHSLGSTAEPSSFEYRSKISTNSSATKSSQSLRSKAGEMHPYANEINAMFDQRKASETKADTKESDLCDRIKNLFISWNNSMEENKENASSLSSNSTVSNNPHIDLGIQLICGIMKAKNIQQRRKKRLVRSIVKRITKVASSCELDEIVSRTAYLIDSTTDDERVSEVQEMPQKVGENVAQRDKKSLISKRSDDGKIQQSIESTKDTKMRTTSKPFFAEQKSITQSAKIDNAQKNVKNQNKKISQKYENVSATTVEPQTSTSTRNSTNKSISPKTLPSDSQKLELGLTKRASKASLSSPSTDISTQQSPFLDISLCITQTASGGNVISAMITQPEKTISSPSTLPSSTPTEDDVPTQKEVTVPLCKRNFDKGTMQEWLNPMTQSEIEYEDKKRSLGAVRKECRKSSSSSRSEKEELKWINSEIERLQSLKKILLNERNPAGSDSDKLYDTVYSDNSQKEKLSNSTDRTNTKKSQNENIQEKRSTKSSDKKSTASPKRSSKLKPKQKAGTEQRVASQRSKIDTPLGTTATESVESFVRQRKQEFLDHYKTQKLDHYDKIINKYNDCPSTSAAASRAGISSQYSANSDGPYSAPAQLQFERPTSYYTYPPPTQQQGRNSYYYEQALAPATTAAKRISSNVNTKTPGTASSELSVPMGSYNTSTSTTTHQYDLAIASATVKNKADIGSQTGHSLVRSKPIYETRCLSPINPMVSCTCTDIVRSTGVQVRPKGVSYSILFPKKPENSKSDNSDINSDAIEEYRTFDQASAPSLQKALMRGNPEFLNQVKKRKSILNRIQKIRQERKRRLHEIADQNMSLNSLDKKLGRLPPPVTAQLRIFPTKQMKAMTNKRVAKLPEVLANRDKDREQRFKRGNRLLRELYNRRLRERVRGGNLNLNHSFTLI